MAQCKIYCNACANPLTEDEILKSDNEPMSDNYGQCFECISRKHISRAVEFNERAKHGGPRTAGPGKKIGRPLVKHPRIKKSYTLTPPGAKRLKELTKESGFKSESMYLEWLLNDAYKTIFM